MSTFAPSTLAELTARLERRRHANARLASVLHDDAVRALEDLDISDLFDSEAPDGGTNVVDHDRAVVLADLALRTAAAAESALDRMGAGAYGTCTSCDERIPLARLRALPETTVCVGCKANEGRLVALAG